MWWKYFIVYAVSLPVATWIGGMAVAWWLESISSANEGLESAARKIGYTERLLIFCFIMSGSFEAVGMLAAAKSLLRFSESRRDKRYAEYVLTGTLASFSVAVLTALGARAVLKWW